MNTATRCTEENVSEDSLGHKCISANFGSNILNNSGEITNTSYRFHTSHCSTISNESDISLLSLSLDKEMEINANPTDIDELPAFEIRLISPLGRTPSPIDSEDMETPTRPLPFAQDRLIISPCRNNPDYVALHDINAQISPPSDHGDIGEDEVSLLSRTSSLETIFEGVFLNTPQRQRLNLQTHRHSRTSLLEKVAINRLNAGKENQSPLLQHQTLSPRHNAFDISCITHTDSDIDHGFS